MPLDAPAMQLSLFGFRLPLRTVLLVLLVLTVGMFATAYINEFVREQNHALAMERFDKRVENAMSMLRRSVLSHEARVVSLQSLFHASENVDRREFADFVGSINVLQTLTSIQALSWNPRVEVAQTQSFEQAVRADTSLLQQGYPDFTVRPANVSKPRYVVKFIEPMQGNEPAFGFDIGSNEARRNTVESARDTGKAQATAPLTLQQESGDQKGFLLVLPVYQSYTPANLEERRSSFTGVVVAVFRIGDLLGGSYTHDFSSVTAMDITPGNMTENTIVLSKRGMEDGDSIAVRRNLHLGGRTWELVFTERPESLQHRHWIVDWAVFGLGSLATLLLAYVAGHLALSQQRAHNLAEQLTVDLKNANLRLKRSNEDLERFAYVASHDLQTPVRNVVSSVALLEEVLDTEQNPEVQEYMGFLKDACSRMRNLINDLLDYSRVSKNQLHKSAVDLNELMSRVKNATSLLFDETNASLQIDAMPIVHADGQSLERVMINLLTNAIHYARKDVPPVIRVSCSESGGMLLIRVSDNGQGIQPEFHQSVFEPFKRLHRQDDISGSGLGLSICKQIVERHDGEIGIESSSDSGTVILMQLPMGTNRSASNA